MEDVRTYHGCAADLDVRDRVLAILVKRRRDALMAEGSEEMSAEAHKWAEMAVSVYEFGDDA